MFDITDTAITPHARTFSRAAETFQVAHGVAHEETMRVAHQHLRTAAEQSGLDPETVFLHADGARSFVGIADGGAGDRTFDEEYGTPERAPNPTLRQAYTALHPHLEAHYSAVLWRELGF